MVDGAGPNYGGATIVPHVETMTSRSAQREKRRFRGARLGDNGTLPVTRSTLPPAGGFFYSSIHLPFPLLVFSPPSGNTSLVVSGHRMDPGLAEASWVHHGVCTAITYRWSACQGRFRSGPVIFLWISSLAPE